MQKYLKKVQKSIELRGWFGTIQHLVQISLSAKKGFSGLNNKPDRANEDDFDAKYGLDTGGRVDLSELSINYKNWIYGASYQPSSANELRNIFGSLGITYQDYIFIDYGSGKGRCLFVAAEYPFHKIIGVEFSSELHNIAQRNINLCKSNYKNIENVLMDAVEFKIPKYPLLCYFYNPFGESVLRKVISNIEDSIRNYERVVYVVYWNPLHSFVIEESGLFETITKNDNCYIGIHKANSVS